MVMECADFDQSWAVMEKGISKLKSLLAGEPVPSFTSSEYMELYETIYQLCKTDNDNCGRVYEKYRLTFVDYISSTVLPALQEKQGESLLREFATRWSYYKTMARWMSRFCHYLDRYYVQKYKLADLNEVPVICFKEMVYESKKESILDAVLFLINQEREGHQVGRAVLKDVVDVYIEIGMGHLDEYTNDFEAPMLEQTSAYYSQNASKYISQADECLKAERDRVYSYLHFSTEPKLLERVNHELLVKRTAQLQL